MTYLSALGYVLAFMGALYFAACWVWVAAREERPSRVLCLTTALLIASMALHAFILQVMR